MSLRVCFIPDQRGYYYGVGTRLPIEDEAWTQIAHLLQATAVPVEVVEGRFVGGMRGMETPWGSSAKAILASIGIEVARIERFRLYDPSKGYDPLLEELYEGLSSNCWLDQVPTQVEKDVEDLVAYNKALSLSLSEQELSLLKSYAAQLGRSLRETEVFGWAQIHSEHCRHKIFNARFLRDGRLAEQSLFEWIKSTTATHPGRVVSAYKDNVAFISGPSIEALVARPGDGPSYFSVERRETLLSLKAETHNFPTTVEPFYGAATGTGGEIRDRMAGGQGSLPLAGTAVYMTPYARLKKLKPWEEAIEARPWLYQRPDQLLIKASNGVSDYSNKFGQPLICGGLLTFEYQSPEDHIYAYDKVVMLAGGIGWAQRQHAEKQPLKPGDLLLLLGGDNYRIGMGGGSVSSVSTGSYASGVERRAVQRANPEMQKRVFDVLRALLEGPRNPILSVHDHGAGGHLNCFAELLEDVGGELYIDALPLGDPSLSYTEILCNESQERMGLAIAADDLSWVEAVAKREGCPLYLVGKVTEERYLRCIDRRNEKVVVDLPSKMLISELPSLRVSSSSRRPALAQSLDLEIENVYTYAAQVLSLEGVACKDWLTNKIDRCVGGRVALQPSCGPLQLPLNNLGVVQLGFGEVKGVATSLGYAPAAGLLSAEVGSRLSLARALSNLLWAPLTHGLGGVSLSANWMWPKSETELDRLYEAVSALSNWATALGVNVPTGKDSLSMQQKYPSGKEIHAPGTVIVSTVAEVDDVRRVVSPVLSEEASEIWYLCLGKDFHLGGSALAQTQGALGDLPPDPVDAKLFTKSFDLVQHFIKSDELLAGHDVSGGGLLTSLLELCFSSNDKGMRLDCSSIEAPSFLHLLFSETPGLLLQLRAEAARAKDFVLRACGAHYLGEVSQKAQLQLKYGAHDLSFDVSRYRNLWYARSAEMDALQRPPELAMERAQRLGAQPLSYRFPKDFTGKWPRHPAHQPIASILRERGSNSDREIAYTLHRAGFRVKDLHMSDLISGRDNLEDTDFLVFVGGFSYADVLGAARGWAAVFNQNPRAKAALESFYAKPETLSLGICNGCQLIGELKLLNTQHHLHPYLSENRSQQFECAFVALEILKSPSLLFSSLSGLRLGAWAAHREGRFVIPAPNDFPVVAQYAYADYPAHPNGSDRSAACLCSKDGRHHAIMPHIERALQPCNWPYYPSKRKLSDEVSPWILPFVAAQEWLNKR